MSTFLVVTLVLVVLATVGLLLMHMAPMVDDNEHIIDEEDE